MKPIHREKIFDQMRQYYNGLVDLMERKNQGYSSHSDDPWANFREIEPLAPASVGLMARLGDKWNRLKSLMLHRENDRVGESIFETIDDMINYLCILRFILLEDEARREFTEARQGKATPTNHPDIYHEVTGE